MGITDDFCFSYSAQCLSAPRPAHRGRLRRRARVGAGCGVLRTWLVTTSPGGARQNRPSATTSGTRECANARPKGTAHVQRPKVSPRRVRSQQSPRWSAERRTSRVMGRRAPALAPAGVRHSPADGCRCTRAPVGAPLPSLPDEGKWQTSEEPVPRENDDACSVCREGKGAPSRRAHAMRLMRCRGVGFATLSPPYALRRLARSQSIRPLRTL